MGKNIVNMFVSSNFSLKSSLKNRKYYSEIIDSELFDEEFYSKTYNDFSGDPLTHYLTKGYKEGKLILLMVNQKVNYLSKLMQ